MAAPGGGCSRCPPRHRRPLSAERWASRLRVCVRVWTRPRNPGPLTTWGLRAALGLEEARRPPASPVLSRRDPALLLRLALLSAVASLCHPSLPPFTFDLKQEMSYFIPERTLLGAGGRDLGKPSVQAVRRKERPRRAERWRLSRVKADQQESRSDDLRAQRRQS